MPMIVLLNDGTTFTNLEGCQLVIVPDDQDITEYLNNETQVTNVLGGAMEPGRYNLDYIITDAIFLRHLVGSVIMASLDTENGADGLERLSKSLEKIADDFDKVADDLEKSMENS